MNINKAIIAGRLTRDPELRAMPSGVQVASLSVATNRTWKDKDGSRQEASDFHNVVVFGKTAESCAQYLKKGQEVLVEGRIQTRSWDDKSSGEKKYRTEIVAENVQFGAKAEGSPDDRSDAAPKRSTRAPASKPAASKPLAGDKGFEYPKEDIDPDDIPF